MGQFVVERRRRLHRGRQLHELLVAGPGHVLELALKRTHRIETVREVFEMAADGLYRLEGSGHIGLAIGSRAQKEVWPQACEWLAKRSG